MRTKIVLTKHPYANLVQAIFEQVKKLPEIKVVGNNTLVFQFDSDLTANQISLIKNIVELNSDFKIQKVEKVK